MNNWGKLFVLAMVPVILSGCASTHFKNIEDMNTFEHVKDEKNLWKQVEDAQRCLVNSGAVYKDPALQAYVDEVLRKLVAAYEDKWGTDLVVYVIYDSDFNAGMWPNGFMTINTGLLAHIDNEAQLAAIMGHELTHYLHRHSLKRMNTGINLSAAAQAIGLLTTAVSSGLAYSGYDPSAVSGIQVSVSLGLQGVYLGYSRSAEAEADQGGFELMKSAGYDVRESQKAMENLLKATNDLDKKHRVPYFYSSHPKTKARVKYFGDLIAELPSDAISPEAVVNTGEYVAKVKNLIIDNVDLDIKKNNIKLAKKQIARYRANYNEDYRSLYLEGLIALRENEKDRAYDKLTQAKELAPEYPPTLKELGLLLYKKGDKTAAKENFNKYLALEPNAKDAEFIRGYINE